MLPEDAAIRNKKKKKIPLVKLRWTDVAADLFIFNWMISLGSVNKYALLIPKHIDQQCSAQIFLIKTKIIKKRLYQCCAQQSSVVQLL